MLGDSNLNLNDKKRILNYLETPSLKHTNSPCFWKLLQSLKNQKPPTEPFVVKSPSLRNSKRSHHSKMVSNHPKHNSNWGEDIEPCDSCGGKYKYKNKPDGKFPVLINHKKKRSFMMYDDLYLSEYPDTLDHLNLPSSDGAAQREIDGDLESEDKKEEEIEGNEQLLDSNVYAADEDIQPCAHCGGKGKKMPQGKVSLEPHLVDGCGCRTSNSPCSCNERGEKTYGTVKVERSVSDTW